MKQVLSIYLIFVCSIAHSVIKPPPKDCSGVFQKQNDIFKKEDAKKSGPAFIPKEFAKKSTDFSHVKAVLKKKGIELETLEKFGTLNPIQQQAFYDQLKKQGLSLDDAKLLYKFEVQKSQSPDGLVKPFDIEPLISGFLTEAVIDPPDPLKVALFRYDTVSDPIEVFQKSLRDVQTGLTHLKVQPPVHSAGEAKTLTAALQNELYKFVELQMLISGGKRQTQLPEDVDQALKTAIANLDSGLTHAQFSLRLGSYAYVISLRSLKPIPELVAPQQAFDLVEVHKALLGHSEKFNQVEKQLNDLGLSLEEIQGLEQNKLQNDQLHKLNDIVDQAFEKLPSYWIYKIKAANQAASPTFQLDPRVYLIQELIKHGLNFDHVVSALSGELSDEMYERVKADFSSVGLSLEEARQLAQGELQFENKDGTWFPKIEQHKGALDSAAVKPSKLNVLLAKMIIVDGKSVTVPDDYEDLLSYKLVSPSGELHSKLEQTFESLTNLVPKTANGIIIQTAGLKAIRGGDQLLAESSVNAASASLFLNVANIALDIAAGRPLALGMAYDAFQVVIGYKVEFGEDGDPQFVALSPFERGAAVFSLAFGGLGNKVGIKNIFKAINKISPDEASRLNQAIEKAGKIVEDGIAKIWPKGVSSTSSTVRNAWREGVSPEKLAIEMEKVLRKAGQPADLTSLKSHATKLLNFASDSSHYELGNGTKIVGESIFRPVEQGSAALAHAFQKHTSTRGIAAYGKLRGSKESWLMDAMEQYKEILEAPGKFSLVTTKKATKSGVRTTTFWEKKLPDGRGLRFRQDGIFETFL